MALRRLPTVSIHSLPVRASLDHQNRNRMKLKITHLPVAILAFAMLLSIFATVSKSQTILDLSGVVWVIAGIILIGIAVGIVVMLLMEKFGHKK